MAKLVWDKAGERLYETGVDHGVFYPRAEDGSYTGGVVWNGLTSVNETPSGAESNPTYADNIKYLNLLSAEDFSATVEAYTYPEEFAVADGSAQPAKGVIIGQQPRKTFGLCYRTNVGNDINGQDHGFKIHMIYGAQASPSERAYNTINESPEAINFSWEIATTPVDVTGYKPTATLVIDSTKTNATKLQALMDILYGTDDEEARLPLPDEIIQLIGEEAAG